MKSAHTGFITNSSTSVSVVVFARKRPLKDEILDEAIEKGYEIFRDDWEWENIEERFDATEEEIITESKEVLKSCLNKLIVTFMSYSSYSYELAKISELGFSYDEGDKYYAVSYVVRYALEWLHKQDYVNLLVDEHAEF